MSDTSTIVANIITVLSANPPLGVLTYFPDWAPEIFGEEMPALSVAVTRFDETRMAGGQNAGEKSLSLDIELVVTEMFDLTARATGGATHRDRVESIVSRLRTVTLAALGANQWAGRMLVERLPPIRDRERDAYVTSIAMLGVTLYRDG
jgi:hypothetical protein